MSRFILSRFSRSAAAAALLLAAAAPAPAAEPPEFTEMRRLLAEAIEKGVNQQRKQSGGPAIDRRGVEGGGEGAGQEIAAPGLQPAGPPDPPPAVGARAERGREVGVVGGLRGGPELRARGAVARRARRVPRSARRRRELRALRRVAAGGGADRLED